MSILRFWKHRHKWETEYVNRWQIPTQQTCTKCGVTRSVDTKQTPDALSYCWVYSNGSTSKPYALGEGLDD